MDSRHSTRSFRVWISPNTLRVELRSSSVRDLQTWTLTIDRTPHQNPWLRSQVPKTVIEAYLSQPYLTSRGSTTGDEPLTPFWGSTNQCLQEKIQLPITPPYSPLLFVLKSLKKGFINDRGKRSTLLSPCLSSCFWRVSTVSIIHYLDQQFTKRWFLFLTRRKINSLLLVLKKDVPSLSSSS